MRIVDLAAGVILGTKYQLLRLVGRGGYAEVWKALRLEDRCDVALKIYRDTERGDPALFREAQLAQAFCERLKGIPGQKANGRDLEQDLGF